jgi:serine/threonine protein phosphatase PrpC
MSVAHKVCGGEAERLRLQGGRVAAHSGEGHIPRVWPRAEDAVPGRPTYGLAVSRSFGDLHWKGVGVCASPDVVLRTIQPQDAFLLLCSDGVTDVMEGQQAVNIAADALHSGKEGSAANAALAVNEEAKRLWASRFPRSKRDDITCVVLPLRALSAETAK